MPKKKIVRNAVISSLVILFIALIAVWAVRRGWVFLAALMGALTIAFLPPAYVDARRLARAIRR